MHSVVFQPPSRLIGHARMMSVGGIIAALSLCAMGCSLSTDRSPPVGEATRSAGHALVGKDGELTVSAANTILNQYSALSVDAAVGATAVTVANIADLTSATFGPIEAGDLVMLYQSQGATIDTTDTAAYGNVTALESAGRYELLVVASLQGNVITIDGSCGGLKHAYATAGAAQVVRVPQLASLTVSAGASITGPAWDGTRGGVVAVHVTGNTTLAGTINANAIGFRGGAVDNSSAAAGSNVQLFRGAAATDGAEKGEGIAGAPSSLPGGRYGRGAPANGGGGGNAHNGGGGGGANGRPAAGFSAWNGSGIMDPNPAWLAAWQLDPAYVANGSARTTSLGGGRGGYTYSANNANALTQGPGNVAWGGDNRINGGGWGGRPLDNDAALGRLFFGGGGGAGDANNNAGGAGGRGGGLVVLLAGAVTGSGSITADGAPGGATMGNGNDAPGGGGAGGAIVVQATSIENTLVASAAGGVGGSQTIAGNEAEGPGGGGGGGFVSISSGTITPALAGGANGTSNSVSVTEFSANGATAGAPGNSVALTGLVACIDSTAPDTTISTAEPDPTNDPTGDFVFGSNETGVTYECSVDGAPFTVCAQTFSTSALSDGPHTISVRAKDAAGNVDETPAAHTWTVDTAPPETTIATSESDPTSDPTGDFVFDSNEPNATFECSVDGGPFVPCSKTYSTSPLPDGKHTIAVRAVDAAGNVDATPATYEWTVDTSGEDSDGDGLTNGQEAVLGTDPNDADSDDDGVTDGDEPEPGKDTDGDGKINALDPDSDDDGLFDGTEMGRDCSGPGTAAGSPTCIADADEGATTTNPLNKDTDSGSVSDGTEDANHNGVVDDGETDPNNAKDDVPCTSDSDCGGPTSGTVCTAPSCVDGCRGTGGNGCAAPLVCTSTDATVGQCVMPDGGTEGGTGGAGGSGPDGGDSGGEGGAGGSDSGTGGKGGSAGSAGGGAGGEDGGEDGGVTDKDGAAGSTGDETLDVDPGSLEGGGCACSTPGEGRTSPYAALLVLAGLATVGARRRNRS
jgi:MYXO-CTERM domain-containing protein